MSDLTPAERDALYSEDRRMNAYYYSFTPTGSPTIDAILSAVAHAGKGYHHTDMWTEDSEWSRWGEGRSAVDVIQAAANDAAAERDRLAECVRAYGRTIDRWGLLIIAATHSEDITTPDGDGDWEVIESRLAEVPALLAERDALAAKLGAVREWIDRRGVNVGDRDDDYMRGYRDAQRHALLDAAELRWILDAETGGES